MICKICGKEFQNLKALSVHLSQHNFKILKYLIFYENFEVPKCPICGKNCKLKGGLIFRKTCSKKCAGILYSQTFSHTEETKEKIRQKRFDYLKTRSGKTAWERRNKGEMSYLEQWFYDNIIIKYNLLEKYDIVYDYPEYPYFIDFAFLSNKIAIELDGRCHFDNGKDRLEHDYKKDAKLIEKGWIILRIKYDENIEENIPKILKFLDTNIVLEKELEKRLYKNNEYKKDNFIKKKVDLLTTTKEIKVCPICGNKHINKIYCSHKCDSLGRQKVPHPDKEILEKLVWEIPTVKIAEQFNVSDKAITKWCKAYDIKKPERGYWNKIKM